MAGAGYNLADINTQVAAIAQRALELKYDAIKLRGWFDRISDDSDDSVAAAALKAAIEGDGGTTTQAECLLIIQAVRQVTYWAMSFAPTYAYDVSGPRQ